MIMTYARISHSERLSVNDPGTLIDMPRAYGRSIHVLWADK